MEKLKQTPESSEEKQVVVHDHVIGVGLYAGFIFLLIIVILRVLFISKKHKSLMKKKFDTDYDLEEKTSIVSKF